MRRDLLWPAARILAAIVGIVALVGAAVVYWGLYDVAADVPQTPPVQWLMTVARDRAVATRAGGIQVPLNLQDTMRVIVGAGLYDDMCSNCHLAPGAEKSEISQGLDPRAPDLDSASDQTPAEQFWTIKHGVTMTGMAAWGKTHPDSLIWDMVAFLRKLPTLSPGRYAALVKSAPKDHDEMMKMEGQPK